MKKLSLVTCLVLCIVIFSACGANNNPANPTEEPNYEKELDVTENQPTSQNPPQENNTNKNEVSTNQGPTSNEQELIGEEKAKSIALKKAGLSQNEVIFERVQLEKDDGIWQYEIEFRKGTTEYDADIKADDGTILSWDVDIDD